MKTKNVKCEICRNRFVPRLNNIMNFLYLSPGSCIQYWIAGQQGRIPTHMCSIVQYHAWEVCGCGIKNSHPVLERIADDFREAQK